MQGKDFVKPDGSDWIDAEILEYFEERYEQSSKGDFYIPGRLPLTQRSALKNWHAVLEGLPDRLRDALHSVRAGRDVEIQRTGA